MSDNMNLRALTPSRKKLLAGDVFAMMPADGRYLFGRVISTRAMIGPMKGCVLIYIYRLRRDTKDLPMSSKLRPDQLLLPPLMTNHLPWARGYFETVAHLPLEPGDMLRPHCFRRYDGQYFDEANHKLAGPVGPVGDWALHSYRTIDDELSKALDIPLAPD